VVFHPVDAVGARVTRKPIFSIDVFAVSLEHVKGESGRLQRAEIGDPLAVGLHNFEILLIDPDDAVKEGVLAIEGLGGDMENIAIDFVDLFGVQVLQVVFRQGAHGDRERGNAREELRVFGLELEILQRSGGSGDGFFVELAVAGTGGIVGGDEFPAGAAIGAKFLDADGFAVSVLGARREIGVFFFCKALNDLRGRKRRWRFGLRDADDAFDFVFRRGSEGPGSVFLSEERRRHEEKQARHREIAEVPDENAEKAGIVVGHHELDANQRSKGRLGTHCNAARGRACNIKQGGRTGSAKIASMPAGPELNINLWKKKLRSVPDYVWERENAETLVLADNELVEVSEKIGQLKQLRMLDLGHNQLRAVPNAVGELAGLSDFLYLHDNQLSVLPASLARLTRLRYLNIGENAFETLPECVCSMAGLIELRISGNRLSELPGAVSRLSRLRELHARNNRLGTLPRAIGQLAELRQIDLRGNPVTHLPEELANMPRLEKLDLRWVDTLEWPGWLAHLEARGCVVYR